MVEEARAGGTLLEALPDEQRLAPFLPPVRGHPGPIHVAEQPRTHMLGIRIFGGQVDEHGRIVLVNFRVEVRTLDVQEAELGPLLGTRVSVRHPVSDGGRGEADDRAESLEGRGRSIPLWSCAFSWRATSLER